LRRESSLSGSNRENCSCHASRRRLDRAAAFQRSARWTRAGYEHHALAAEAAKPLDYSPLGGATTNIRTGGGHGGRLARARARARRADVPELDVVPEDELVPEEPVLVVAPDVPMCSTCRRSASSCGGLRRCAEVCVVVPELERLFASAGS